MIYTLPSMLETPGRRSARMAVDLLSDALTFVRLTGALIFRVDIAGPWGIAADPKVEKFAPLLPPGTNQIVVFHIVLDGGCWIRRPPLEWFHVSAGQAVVIAHGDPHDLCDQPGRITEPFSALLGDRTLLDLRHASFRTGPGDSVSLLCGFLGCDRRAFEPLCRSLPPVFTVDIGARENPLVHYAVANALDDSPGAAGLRGRLAELLFLCTLQTHVHKLPADASGWLAGLRDPLVGKALLALHERPCRRWSVEDLAAATASSRSNLAARFNEIIGEPPMHYLTRLRMQLAARRLTESRHSIASVANEVGYDSSAAFQRAFKRCFGVPPAAWRRRGVVAP